MENSPEIHYSAAIIKREARLPASQGHLVGRYSTSTRAKLQGYSAEETPKWFSAVKSPWGLRLPNRALESVTLSTSSWGNPRREERAEGVPKAAWRDHLPLPSFVAALSFLLLDLADFDATALTFAEARSFRAELALLIAHFSSKVRARLHSFHFEQSDSWHLLLLIEHFSHRSTPPLPRSSSDHAILECCTSMRSHRRARNLLAN